MDNFIEKKRSKYAGFDLTKLIILATSGGPASNIEKNEVWKELFYRYFNEGREFNLYEILKGNHRYFAITIAWELKHSNIEIPTLHIVHFVENLLAFIKFIDEQLLVNKNLTFEWQIHELEGIKNMLEKIKEAKVQDNNLKQKINLFIDKMNKQRKESLLLLEEQKEELEKNNQIALYESKTQLLKQELKHLDIALSKVKKADFILMLINLNLYYDEDKYKIIVHGLKKYSYETRKEHPWRSFVYNLKAKVQEIDMFSLLLHALKTNVYFSSYNKFDINLLFNGCDSKGLIHFLKNWITSIDGYDEKTEYQFLKMLYESLKTNELDSEHYNQYLIERLRKNSSYLNQFKNKNLTYMFSNFIEAEENEDKYVGLKIVYNKSLQSWEFQKPKRKIIEVTYIEKYYKLFEKITDVQDGIIEYSGDILSNNSDFKIKVENVTSEIYNLCKNFIDFIPSIQIDDKFYSYFNNAVIRRIYNNDSFSRQNTMNEFIRHKFNRKAISMEEIRNLYTIPEIYKFFHKVTDTNFSSGHYQNRDSYLFEYLAEAITMFDFTNSNERSHFFNLPIDFLKLHKSKYEMTIHLITNKLKDELPHEYFIVEEFYNGELKTYTDFILDEGYEYGSALDKLMYQLENRKIGENVTRTGFKDYLYGREVFLEGNDAKNIYILKYFQRAYRTEDYR